MVVDHLIYAAPELTAAIADPEQPAPPMQRPFGVDNIACGALVGWALACDDIDRAVAEARGHGYDPGEVDDGHRVGPTGMVLRGRATGSALTDGLVPFLISWGDTEHPARSAPRGLSLKSLQIEHPDPPSLMPALTALGVDIEVTPATVPALVAHLRGPTGGKALQ